MPHTSPTTRKVKMKTISEVLDRNRGIGPGFDFLRIFLATSIVAVHSVLLTGNRARFESSIFWFLEYALVPMFFALSGFLIAGSAGRLSLKNFLINRGLRIVPALAVDIVVCALIIGPLVTTATLSEYYGGTDFYSYFLNIVGYIHYQLPGVFKANPTTNVNGALWTVPYEILCYVLTSCFILAGWLKSRWKVLTTALLMTMLAILLGRISHVVNFSKSVEDVVSFLFWSREAQIVTAFLLGMAAFQWRDRIAYDWRLALVALALCFGGALFHDFAMKTTSRLVLLPALTYLTIFVGLTHVPIPKYFTKGDYSYGVYLYHDPFLQIVISLMPAVAAIPLAGAGVVFAIGYCMVLIVSNLSWNFIEKPILGLRKKFSFVARVRDLGPDKYPDAERKATETVPMQ